MIAQFATSIYHSLYKKIWESPWLNGVQQNFYYTADWLIKNRKSGVVITSSVNLARGSHQPAFVDSDTSPHCYEKLFLAHQHHKLHLLKQRVKWTLDCIVWLGQPSPEEKISWDSKSVSRNYLARAEILVLFLGPHLTCFHSDLT